MHPHLLPAFCGALLGFGVLAYAAWRLARRWNALPKRARRLALAALALAELVYWGNVYAWFIEPNLLAVRRYEIESAAWRGPPLTIAAIGDVHVAGPHVRAPRVQRLVARVNAMEPDLVLLLGDYVNGHYARAARSAAEQNEIANGLSAFAALDARLGVVGVIGNHDSWYDRAEVRRLLEEAGVAVLWDDAVTIDRAGAPFSIIGLEDEMTGDPDYAEASAGAEAGLDRIVISHSPDVFPALPQGDALVLAAHTHCGQVSVPFLGRPITPSRYGQRYACGFVSEDGKQMIVTGGIGTSIFPLRFLNPPEIALITLRGASSAP